MKKLKLKLPLIAFMLAIGSAFASEKLFPTESYTRKVDLPTQVENCMERGTCDGSSGVCSATFGTITVNFYNATCTSTLNGSFTSE